MADKAVDGAKEKHVPVIEANGEGCKVKVGSAPHVMEETHWIEWIEVTAADGKRYKKFLKPGDAPEADFCIPADKVVSAREYCTSTACGRHKRLYGHLTTTALFGCNSPRWRCSLYL